MIVKFAMQCSHVREAPFDDIKEKMFCNICNRQRKVKAIESREWYFKCGGCRYARFTGQSESQAKTLLGVHHVNTHHIGGNVWYRRHPDKSAKIREIWGRKIRDVLVADHKIYPDEYLPKGYASRPIQEVILPGDDKVIPF